MELLNLTPHPINFLAQGINLPPSGLPTPRVATSSQVVGHIYVDGKKVDLIDTQFGEVQNLPEASFKKGEPETMYVVSRLVIQAAQRQGLETGHLVSPGTLIRNEKGEIIGCQNLSF